MKKVMFYLRQIFFVTVMLAANVAHAQVILEDYVFDEPEEEPIKELEYPEPGVGYRALLKSLQDKISNGDTLGKKYAIDLWGITYRVNQQGKIDSTFIWTKFGNCGIHEEVTKLLKETQWYPATREGKPISFKYGLHGYYLYFNKNSLKRCNCW